MACNSISYTSFIANIKIVNIFFPYFIHMFYPQSIMAGVERLELSLTSVLETGVLPITPNPYLSHGINFSNSLGTSALLHFTYPFSILCHSVNLLRSVLCDITYSSPERVLQVNNELVSFCGICFANLAFDVPSFIIYLFPLCTF